MSTQPAEPSTIVFIVPYMEAAGTERHVLHLARALHGRYRLGLLAPPGPLLDQFLELGVEHRPFPRLEQNLAQGVQAFRRGLRELVDQLKPDLLHVHAGPELCLLARTVDRSTPIVLTIHAFHGPHAEANYRLAGWLARMAGVLRVIAVSQSEARLLQTGGLRAPRLQVVYNGIPDSADPPIHWRRERGWPADAPVIGAVGRLDPPKGFPVLLQAFAWLDSSAYPSPPRLVIVGDGPQKQELLQLSRELHVEDRVFFAGYRPDSRRAFGGFDVTVIPSLQDGLPLVCLEAMAAGCPVIASDTGGLPEMVVHQETGLVVPPQDPAALKRALEALLQDPQRAREMGRRGRRRFVEHFHLDQMVHRTLAVYREAFAVRAPAWRRQAG